MKNIFTVLPAIFLLWNIPLLPAEFLIGTSTHKNKSLGAYQGDLLSAACHLRLAIEANNPSFLIQHPRLNVVYVVHEVSKYNGKSQGAVSAQRYQGDSWINLGEMETTGASPCHLALNPSANILVVVNYTGANIVGYSISNDGSLGELIFNIKHEGQGPNSKRQKSAHPHGVYFVDDEHFWVCDLGTDSIDQYSLKPEGEKFTWKKTQHLQATPGAGPRHGDFPPMKNYFYILNELNGTVVLWKLNSLNQWESSQELSTLPTDFKGTNTCAEVSRSPAGRWLLASNRGHDSLAVYGRDDESGRLTFSHFIGTEGQHPRSFAFSSDGQQLIVANRDSNNLAVFQWNEVTGQGELLKKVELASPICVLPLFAR
jgi:6-phosphogluconolactonase